MDTLPETWQKQKYRVRMAAGGRIVIPADVRQELGVKEGDELLLTREPSGIRITTVEQTVREVQAFFAQFKKPGESVVDEFLEERREEAAKEEREFEQSRPRRKA